MATLVDCPTCARKLRVPDDLLGSAVRCPDCGGTFAAQAGPPAAPAADAPAPPPADATPSPGTPHSVTGSAPASPPAPGRAGEETRACPACGERIPTTAARCPACREDLGEEDDRPWEKRRRHLGRMDSEPHRGTVILVLGILGLVLGVIGLPMAIIAWVMGHNDLKKIRAGAMDPEGEGLTQAGRVCGIIGTIWQSLMTLGCVGYFVLIFAFMFTAVRMTPTSPPVSATMKAVPVAPMPPPVPPPAVAPRKAAPTHGSATKK